jgi:hypothetical protein
MPRPLALLATLALSAFSAPAAAQIVRYECRTAPVTGTSAPERSQRAARRAAEDAWVASARSQHRFAYRWALAQEVRPTRITSRGSDWVGTAQAHPCRVHVEGPRGTLTTSQTPESVRVCGSFPTLAEAERHGCTFFYPLRR